MANLSKVIYINEEDYSTLLNGGTITKGGVTYSHDPTALYVIKNVSAPEYAETAGYATTAGQATKATQDGNGDVISETYAKKADAVEAIYLTGTLSGGYWTFEDNISGNTLTDAEMIALLEDPNKLISIYYDGFSDGTRTYDATVFRPIGSDSTTFTSFDGNWGRYFYISLDWENGRVFDNEHIMGDSLESKQKEIITLGGTNNAPTFTGYGALTHFVFKTQYLDSSKKDVILKVQTSTDVYHYYQLFKSEKQSSTLTNYRFISFSNTSAVECIELLYNSSNNTFQRGGSSVSLQTLINSGNKLSADYIQDGTNNKVFSAADKTKLDGIATGAEVNVQANWTETDTNSDAYIQNKPTIPTVNDGTLTIKQSGVSRGTFTANQSRNDEINIISIVYGKYAAGEFREGVFSGGTWTYIATGMTLEMGVLYIDVTTKKVYYYDGTGLKETYSPDLSPYANVQANWNETDDTSDAYIWNKPTIPDTLKVGSVAGKLYRNNVGGSGNFSISGNSGCIPNLVAGTYQVAIYAKSSTQAYVFRFNFGSSVTYDLTARNGIINDFREITIPSDGTFSGLVLNSSVASGTILYVVMYDYVTPVSTVGVAAVTNRYSDLDGTPTNISSFTNNAGYITSTAITDLTDIL